MQVRFFSWCYSFVARHSSNEVRSGWFDRHSGQPRDFDFFRMFVLECSFWIELHTHYFKCQNNSKNKSITSNWISTHYFKCQNQINYIKLNAHYFKCQKNTKTKAITSNCIKKHYFKCFANWFTSQIIALKQLSFLNFFFRIFVLFGSALLCFEIYTFQNQIWNLHQIA